MPLNPRCPRTVIAPRSNSSGVNSGQPRLSRTERREISPRPAPRNPIQFVMRVFTGLWAPEILDVGSQEACSSHPQADRGGPGVDITMLKDLAE
jgi:hypothetical protein